MWLDVALIVAFPAFICFVIISRIRNRRIYLQRVRDWARENGYAILSMTYHGPALAAIGVPFMQGPHMVTAEIQDDQGGQTTVSIYMKNPSAPPDVSWGC